MTKKGWEFKNLEEYIAHKRAYCWPSNVSERERKEFERDAEIQYFKETDPVFTAERTMRACKKLWTALTDKEHVPHLDEDLTVDHIKPTREYRKFVYELDEDERAGLHNWLTYTEAVISDMLEKTKTNT